MKEKMLVKLDRLMIELYILEFLPDYDKKFDIIAEVILELLNTIDAINDDTWSVSYSQTLIYFISRIESIR